MARKNETACKSYPGRFLAGGSTSHKYNTNFRFISQVWRSFRRMAIVLLIGLVLWGLCPISWADKLVEGLRHD